MAKCYTCGEQTSDLLQHNMTCPKCEQVKETRALREAIPKSLGELAQAQERALEKLSEEMSKGFSQLSSVLEWGFAEVSWQLHEQTTLLRDIAHTLKTPSQTQAEELRQMAEQLRERGVLEDSESRFLKALELNPLDYRTYVGLHYTYLRLGQFDKAKGVLEKSLPHAPRGEARMYETEESEKVLDYRSYSYRLIGRIYYCREDYPQAVEALRKSIDLSPEYSVGHYDFAQYCALMRKQGECLDSLRKAILGRPLYHYLAQDEKNLDPLRTEVAGLLQNMSAIALEEVKQPLTKLEERLHKVKKAILVLEEAEAQSASQGSTLSAIYDAVEGQLGDAKRLSLSGKYNAILEAQGYVEAIGVNIGLLVERVRKQAEYHESAILSAPSERWPGPRTYEIVGGILGFAIALPITIALYYALVVPKSGYRWVATLSIFGWIVWVSLGAWVGSWLGNSGHRAAVCKCAEFRRRWQTALGLEEAT